MGERIQGTVKWYSSEKGYGFITRADGPDVHVRHAAIEGSGFRTLIEGETVEFEVIQDERGIKAANVKRLNPPADSGGGGYGGGGGGRGGGGYGGGGGSGRGGSGGRDGYGGGSGSGGRDRDW